MIDDYLVDLLVLVNAEAIASEHRVHISPGTIDGFLKTRKKNLKLYFSFFRFLRISFVFASSVAAKSD